MNMVVTLLRFTLCTGMLSIMMMMRNEAHLYHSSMESLLNKHKDNAAIQVIHFPHELERKETLLKGKFCKKGGASRH